MAEAGSAEAGSESAQVGTLSQIWIYPIKSCRRVALDEAAISATGLAGDRLWQVVNEQGDAVTQRTDPKLALVEVIPNSDASLTLAVAGSDQIAVPALADAQDNVTVKALAGDEVRCADAGDQAAEFFSDVLGRAARLVGFTNTTQRPAFFAADNFVTFVDAAPITVANTASLAHLAALADQKLEMERFRPNLVVDTQTPWVEDTWDHFSIGQAELDMFAPWPRCAVPQIHQDTATRSQEPAKVLKQHRWCTDAAAAFPDDPGFAPLLENNALFAIACVPSSSAKESGATLRVSDTVTVDSLKPALLAPPE